MATDDIIIPEMVERIARSLALSTHLRLTPANTTEGLRTLVDITWRGFIPDAEQAIAAMREPTETMVAAAPDRAIKTITIGTGAEPTVTELTDPAVNWRAMIDAALHQTRP